MKIEEIKKYWNNKAVNRKITDEVVTLPDLYLRWLEIELLKKHLKKSTYVIDLGCGNGHSTIQFAPLVSKIVGIDYAENMILRARQKLKKLQYNNISFEVGDVTSLSYPDNTFDIAITERCLINVSPQKKQFQAIQEIHRVLKKGGIFLMMEGCEDGRKMINSIRKKMGLHAIPDQPFNLHFNVKSIQKFLESMFIIQRTFFWGLYDFISKVVYPSFIKPKEPNYNHPINKIAAQLALESPNAMGEYCREFLFVLKKPR